MRRTGFTWETVTRVADAARQVVISRELDEAPAGGPLYLAEAQAAFVHDTAVLGPVGPIVGQRLRLEIEPAFGRAAFADLRADFRRYVMPVRPLTIAARVQHVGRYGPGADDPRLTPLVDGLRTLVRGYDLRSFAAAECGWTASSCSLMDQLRRSRLALVNLELRAPIPGIVTGALDDWRVPIEAIAFADAGYLWTGQRGRIERDRFRSVGVGGRANLGGFVFELAAARRFDSIRTGWTVSFLLRPGW